MQRGLKNSRRFLIDLLAARDANQDGYLEYTEFEDMLLQDLQVNFGPKLYDTVVLAQLLDPSKRQSKIKNEIIKLYLGEGESASIMDMVPSQENQRARGKAVAGRSSSGGAAADKQQTKASRNQRKML